MLNVLTFIEDACRQGRALLAVLVDPGKLSLNKLRHLLTVAESSPPDLFLVGGSTSEAVDVKSCVAEIRSMRPGIPVVIFPGNETQIDDQADALLLLSLISGRNPDLLIGKHVEAARKLKRSGLEIIPTGYILIESGKVTSVAYMSQTQPIPRDKSDIAAKTALSAELLGMKLVYLEAGSGAKWPVPPEMIHAVKLELDIPLIVGGGIDSMEKLSLALDAGANLVVVGNALEKDPELLHRFYAHLSTRSSRFQSN